MPDVFSLSVDENSLVLLSENAEAASGFSLSFILPGPPHLLNRNYTGLHLFFCHSKKTGGRSLLGCVMMLVKLFVLGNPGSGKSTIARSIESFAKDERWSYQRFNDYTVLLEMVDEDRNRSEEQKWFRCFDEGKKEKGFDVLNVEAFDRALCQVEQEATAAFAESEAFSPQKNLALIEFARNDYERAFKQFSRAFLQNAYFVYLDVRMEICIQRIHQRVKYQATDDDYYVSDYILQTYYRHGDGRQLEKILGEYGIGAERIRILDNNVDLAEASTSIGSFAQHILSQTTGFIADQQASFPIREGLSLRVACE